VAVVSVLYREPKLLKVDNEPICIIHKLIVSVLYREPKLLKAVRVVSSQHRSRVSVLYREPKLLKVY
jgi:hypothetical protein